MSFYSHFHDYVDKTFKNPINMDPEYVQTYVGLASVYGRPKDRKKAIENIKIAYEKTLKAFPKWPNRMEWGILENRAYLRAIQIKNIDFGKLQRTISRFVA